MKKLLLAGALMSFAFAPAMAGGQAGAGNKMVVEAKGTATAACMRGYRKNPKTGRCFKLHCARKGLKLSKGGHKCVRKGRMSGSHRGSY